ncbi:ribosomal 40S subunit protein S13 [Stygiomarasmius scandens]|uniref:Ribosomal 40S subunit protein S13 n=1 Tax=Marasmiellus scandens TaxID=2682957 RepID=A0ABR1J1B2_9AGAR
MDLATTPGSNATDLHGTLLRTRARAEEGGMQRDRLPPKPTVLYSRGQRNGRLFRPEPTVGIKFRMTYSPRHIYACFSLRKRFTFPRQEPWVVCTLPERVFPPLSSHTATLPCVVEDHPRGSRRRNYQTRSEESHSQIGVTLRDSHGMIRFVTGKKPLHILKSQATSSPSSPSRISFVYSCMPLFRDRTWPIHP